MSDDRVWCCVSPFGIEEFNLTSYQAKAMAAENPGYTAMLTEDAETLLDGE